MIEIILNEKEWVEGVLKTPSLGIKPTATLGRIAKYYYAEGRKKKEVEKLLSEYIIRCDPKANMVKWEQTVERIARSAKKYPLVDVPCVEITDSEMRTIESIDSIMLQRLLFTMLCLAKYGNAVSSTNNNWVNRSDKDIFSLANIAITSSRKQYLINDLWNLGYIGYSRVVDNVNLNVKMVDYDSPVVMTVTDFRNLGNQYRMFHGENYFECECCGLIVKRSHGRQRLCSECAARVNREKAAERYRCKTVS